MENAFGLLLTALVACVLIGRIDRSIRTFWSLMLALALGFVGGATISKFVVTDNSTAVVKEFVQELEDAPTFLLAETPFVGKTANSRPEGMGQVYFQSPLLRNFSPRVMIVHPQCLSPPFNTLDYG